MKNDNSLSEAFTVRADEVGTTLNAVVNQMLLHSSLKVANDLTGLWCLLGKRSRHAQFLRCRSKCLELVVLFRFTFSLLPACPA